MSVAPSRRNIRYVLNSFGDILIRLLQMILLPSVIGNEDNGVTKPSICQRFLLSENAVDSGTLALQAAFFRSQRDK